MVVKKTELKPRSRKEWRGWLQKQHSKTPGVWLVFARKASGLPTVPYVDAVEEALCFGWIDGTVNSIDQTYYKQWFAPRKARSTWAATNKARVKRLTAAGLMRPAGLKAIELAKENGSWTTLDAAEAMIVPPALKTALNANASAQKHWNAFTASQRKQFLYRVTSARREETRARRIAEVVAMAAARRTPQMDYDERRAKKDATGASR